MPSLDVTMPRSDLATKVRLAEGLTAAFAAYSGFGEAPLGVRFLEYGPGEVAEGGRIWDGTNAPFLHLVLSCPRMRRQAKREVVAALTRSFSQAMERPEWLPVIHIHEHPYDNVGVGGQLLSDAFEACRARRFYYDLPED